MKVRYLIVILFFANSVSKAADTTIAKLAQKIVDLHVKWSYHHFYLFNRASAPEFNEYTIIDINKITDVPKAILLDLLKNSQLHQSAFYWKNFHLKGIKIIDEKHIPPYPPLAQLLKGKWIIDNDGKVVPNPEPIDTTALDGSIRFSFSKPVFLSDRQYAFISVLNGESAGGFYLLKNDHGSWVIIFQERRMT